MTATLLSLLSISVGILGAILMGYLFKKHSLGLTGNAIVGVFGGILMMKSFGRLGFDVSHVLSEGEINLILLTVLLVMSLFAGGGALVLVKIITSKVL